jgi:extradiol dioxygenase family protein
MTHAIFHLSFPVRDLDAAKAFYRDVLGATIGRETAEWSDILLFGHQLTLHERPAEVLAPEARGVRHFGVILPWAQWEALGREFRENGWPLLMAPTITHAGSEREQGKMLLCDPSDNVVEIKAYRDATVALGGVPTN